MGMSTNGIVQGNGTSSLAGVAAQTTALAIEATVKSDNKMTSSQFATEMAGKSNKDLSSLLGMQGLSETRKEEIAAELLKRMEAAKTSAASNGTASEETNEETTLKRLLEKLKKGETLTPNEMQKLTELLAKNETTQDTTPSRHV
ncbi:hypothetical protein [Actimicrobium antarcticum]|uniref:Uncharacterized protein n=1 Tax=Actimicrobium antarcticum TaxID=1051899 RepID=A0ABP7TNI3_9BURK